MGSDPAESRRRDHGIDAFRFVGAAAVVLLHGLAGSLPHTLPKVLAATACRFAVPFFFLVSGYYSNTAGCSKLKLVLAPFANLAPIFFGTIAIYYVASFFVPLGNWEDTLDDSKGGPAFHLWFLPALAISLACARVGESIIGLRMTLLATSGIALLGLAITSYGDLFGSPYASGRSGWYCGTVFIALGMSVRRCNVAVPRLLAALMVIASYALLLAEEILLQHATRASSLRSHDILLSTFIFGIAVLLLARSVEEGPLIRLLARAGRLSLGIYTFHVLFLRMWQLVLSRAHFVTAQTVLATLVTAMIFTWLVARIPIARRLVTTERAGRGGSNLARRMRIADRHCEAAPCRRSDQTRDHSPARAAE